MKAEESLARGRGSQEHNSQNKMSTKPPSVWIPGTSEWHNQVTLEIEFQTVSSIVSLHSHREMGRVVGVGQLSLPVHSIRTPSEGLPLGHLHTDKERGQGQESGCPDEPLQGLKAVIIGI